MSLSKSLNPLLNTGLTQERNSPVRLNIVDWYVKRQHHMIRRNSFYNHATSRLAKR